MLNIAFRLPKEYRKWLRRRFRERIPDRTEPGCHAGIQYIGMDIMNAVKKSNLDIGAETMEINKVEYLDPGVGIY